MNQTVDTIAQTVSAVAPAALAAATASNPQAATVAAIAPLAVALLNNAVQLAQAGAMPPDQLASLFETVGQQIKATHDAWAAMDAQ